MFFTNIVIVVLFCFCSLALASAENVKATNNSIQVSLHKRQSQFSGTHRLGICHERLEMCKERMTEIRTLKDNDFKQFVLIVRGDEKEQEFIEQYSAFLQRQFKSEK